MISIVICSINEDRFASAAKKLSWLLRGEEYEIIRISDARSLSEGYTRGLNQSRGEYLVFCHDDIEILTPEFATRLKMHLAEYDLFGVAGTNRLINGNWCGAGLPYIFGQIAHAHPQEGYVIEIFGVRGRSTGQIQALDGVFLAARRSLFEIVIFDSDTFDGFHHYDLDLSFSAYLSGFRLGVVNDIPIIHTSIGNRDDIWRGYCERFVGKYADRLPNQAERPYGAAWIYVKTKAEVLEVMDGTYRSASSQVTINI